MNPAKRLAIRLTAEEENFISGQLDLNVTLEETERLFNEELQKGGDLVTATELKSDSSLMKIQTGLAKKSAKFYKPDSLVFNATEFSTNLKRFYDQTFVSQNTSQLSQLSERENENELLWLHLGNEAKRIWNTVPSISLIHGTFEPDPIEVVKKKRKMREKDEIGKATKPESSTLSNDSENTDVMIKEAGRVLGILQKVLLKANVDAVCFYEFTVDPKSFGRTVENMFILSLLVKEGCVKIFEDRSGLPCLSVVRKEDKKDNPTTNQSIINIDVQKWKNIVQTLNLETALIPPRRSVKPS